MLKRKKLYKKNDSETTHLHVTPVHTVMYYTALCNGGAGNDRVCEAFFSVLYYSDLYILMVYP